MSRESTPTAPCNAPPRASAPDVMPDFLAARLADHDFERPPGAAGGLEWIQTHISHVFLVGDRVYKLRKAVRQPFLDFSTRQRRNADCERELHLNRRLAPEVYLGLVSLRPVGESIELGSLTDRVERPELEHLVVMRRLPEGRDAIALLDGDRLGAPEVERIANRLTEFHKTVGLGVPAPWPADVWFERTLRPTRECVDSIAESGLLPSARIDALTSRVDAESLRLRDRMEARRQEGRAVDGHGDLHLDHIWFETDGAEPLMIDCLEFNQDLRRIDRASELAFLTMDFAYRDREDLGEYLLSCYAGQTDDYGLFGVVDYYAAYRALVRAKVAAIAAGQATIDPDQRERARGSAIRHVDLAESMLALARRPGVVLLCGTVGSGKSTVARQLAQSAQGIQIASDRVRKRRGGLADTDRTQDAPDAGLYSPENTEAVYDGLLERAGAVVESGRVAILDAGYARRSQRDRARQWAEARGISIRLSEVCCQRETAAQRLAERERQARDPSDAGPELLPISLERFEPPDEWPAGMRQIVHTDRSPS